MKDRIIPIKNPALPFYHSDVKSKIKDTIEVTYNTNAFYIFCKNFEVIAAEVFKFEKIKKEPETLLIQCFRRPCQGIDATRFELATSASRTQRSTKLSHASLIRTIL